jgi:hypothetical protein
MDLLRVLHDFTSAQGVGEEPSTTEGTSQMDGGEEEGKKEGGRWWLKINRRCGGVGKFFVD